MENKYEVTYVCPSCGAPVTWTKIKLDNGSEINGLDWYCKKCGSLVFETHRGNRSKEGIIFYEEEDDSGHCDTYHRISNDRMSKDD